jgi:hypothetical protein
VYQSIDSAKTLADLESIIVALDRQRLTGRLLFCVVLYVIDDRKLYLQADCRSISALANKYKRVFDVGPSGLSKDRKIGEGFYRNGYWLRERGVYPTDLGGRVSHLAHLSEARANKNDDEIISALLSMDYEQFKAFSASPHRKISGGAKVPTGLSAEKFERELYPLIESRATTEQRKLIDDVYQRDEASGHYNLDKSTSLGERDRIVDTLYYVGFKNRELHNLENWMEVGVRTKLTDLPMGQRTPKILFPDDKDVPRKEVWEAVLREVRKQILKAGGTSE